MANKRSQHYVDDAKLYEVICKYKQDLAVAEAQGLPKPRVPEFVGKCIMEIAERLASKHNFARYIFKDEMIGDGIENCIKYFHNFDEVKYKKPFNYLTTIIYWAFVRRIEQEKTYLYTKYKLYEDVSVIQSLHEARGGDENKSESNGGLEGMDSDKMTSFIESFEKKIAKKKSPKAKKGIEKFVED